MEIWVGGGGGDIRCEARVIDTARRNAHALNAPNTHTTHTTHATHTTHTTHTTRAFSRRRRPRERRSRSLTLKARPRLWRAGRVTSPRRAFVNACSVARRGSSFNGRTSEGLRGGRGARARERGRHERGGSRIRLVISMALVRGRPRPLFSRVVGRVTRAGDSRYSAARPWPSLGGETGVLRQRPGLCFHGQGTRPLTYALINALTELGDID